MEGEKYNEQKEQRFDDVNFAMTAFGAYKNKKINKVAGRGKRYKI